MAAPESVIVAIVREAEELVSQFRERHDPAAQAGVPAHITCLYPFIEPSAIDAPVSATLRDCFSRIAPFGFALAAVRSFRSPDAVLYLAPEPDAPFRALTEAICTQFPTVRPYGGRHADIVPHLTVAHPADGRDFKRIAEEFGSICRGKLPIHATAAEVALMCNTTGRWRVRETFRLGSA